MFDNIYHVCFITNTSDTTHLPGDINQLTYVWNIGGNAAYNNFGSNSVSVGMSQMISDRTTGAGAARPPCRTRKPGANANNQRAA